MSSPVPESQALVTPDIHREQADVSSILSADQIDRAGRQILDDVRALMAEDPRSLQLRSILQDKQS